MCGEGDPPCRAVAGRKIRSVEMNSGIPTKWQDDFRNGHASSALSEHFADMEGDRDLIPGQGITLASAWHALVRERWLIVAGLVLGMTLTGLYCIYAKPYYTAYAQLKYDPDKGRALNIEDISAAAASGGETDEKLQTEVLVLQSETLALDVIYTLHLWEERSFIRSPIALKADDPADKDELLRRYRTSIVVHSIPKSNLIEISVRTLSPKVSAAIANSLIDKYIERNYRVKYEGTMKASEWLNEQLEGVRKKAEKAETTLADYQRNTGVFAFGSSRSNQGGEGDGLIATQLSETMKALTGAVSDAILKEARYRVAIGGDPELLAGMLPDPALAAMHVQEVSLRNQFAAAKIQFGENYPQYKQLKSQLDESTLEIAAEVKSDTRRLKDEFESAKKAESALDQQLSIEKTKALDSNRKVLVLMVLEREAESTRELYEGLSRKLQEAGITAGLNSTNVEVVDYARPPWRPSDPKVARILAFGFMGGVGLGCLAGFCRKSFDNTYTSDEEVEKESGLPVIGAIPAIRPGAPILSEISWGGKLGASDTSQVAYTQPKSEAAERFRTLRSSILLSDHSSGSRVLVVTSCMPGDGKTTVCSNLAVVLAQNGAKVLLIDADMRLGQLQRRFHGAVPEGLSSVLAGLTRLDETTHVSEHVENLRLLFAGPVPPYPAELLASQAMGSLLAECRQKYDFVIVDTPPVLAVTDAVILAANADRTLLVVRPGHTVKKALKQTRVLLSRAGAVMGGAVVNAMSLKSATYNSYYKKNRRYYGDPAKAS